MILRFVTGSENEPILGFSIQPCIEFCDSMPSSFPVRNTCANKLTLPCGEIVPKEQDKMFEFYDMAFANQYFGKA